MALAGKHHRVVILGAGFGGLSAAKTLAKAPVDVTVIDRRNYHLFQPLLYQVATAGLSPSDVAAPIRAILRGQSNARVLLGRVQAVDRQNRIVLLSDGRRVPFDSLIVATGARHAYFGHDEWEPVAPGLKKIEDAIDIRRRILLAFEKAEMATDDATRQRLLTFAVIGAGPTGVELVGAIAELARMAVAADFRDIDPRQARILLVEAADRALTSFPERLSAKAKTQLEDLGVELLLGAKVTRCDDAGIEIEDGAGRRFIPAATVLWAAGVQASPAAKWLGVDGDRAGRVPVTPQLHLPDDPNLFVIGDTALVRGADGKPLPGVAPVAKQEGEYVARRIRSTLAGKSIKPFAYRNYGNLATIGRKAAVADFGWIRLSGTIAWLLWGIVHIFFLIGFRNRIFVLLSWLWAYFSFHRGSRLITGGDN
ncbi:NADH dehydrogenase [Hypericibacter terrae]|uniref:NADH:ubiquinone reductase (non-electrogenic) n=1 Tax=Hypericibacter terrae TaxID=2602015 RepID=A0A5J6MJ44_9PROT|nr:NAD(P)/FAD-dependent oxidoreductase [Hypericibacter terrae]QEX17474.1 NADH dehydrogenase [Hypericibacter terrae]